MRIKAFFFLVLITTACYAQKSFMSLTMGSSIPVGSFSESEDIYSDGFAGSNFVINFDGAYFFMPVVGVGGTFSFGSSYSGGESLENAMYNDIINHDGGVKPHELFYIHWVLEQCGWKYGLNGKNLMNKEIFMNFNNGIDI